MDSEQITTKVSNLYAQGVIIQDTAWEGYADIPTWIMQGYGQVLLPSVCLSYLCRMSN